MLNVTKLFLRRQMARHSIGKSHTTHKHGSFSSLICCPKWTFKVALLTQRHHHDPVLFQCCSAVFCPALQNLAQSMSMYFGVAQTHTATCTMMLRYDSPQLQNHL